MPKADPFDVWGQPPKELRNLSTTQQNALRRYINSVSSKTYRIAFDSGLNEALARMTTYLVDETRLQRSRMFKSQ